MKVNACSVTKCTKLCMISVAHKQKTEQKESDMSSLINDLLSSLGVGKVHYLLVSTFLMWMSILLRCSVFKVT